jgi:hypothetical protein
MVLNLQAQMDSVMVSCIFPLFIQKKKRERKKAGSQVNAIKPIVSHTYKAVGRYGQCKMEREQM